MSSDTAKATAMANEALSLMLHHDAITGTHSPLVGADYDRRLASTSEKIGKILSSLVAQQALDMIGLDIDILYHCPANDTCKLPTIMSSTLALLNNPTLQTIRVFKVKADTCKLTVWKLDHGKQV